MHCVTTELFWFADCLSSLRMAHKAFAWCAENWTNTRKTGSTQNVNVQKIFHFKSGNGNFRSCAAPKVFKIADWFNSIENGPRSMHHLLTGVLRADLLSGWAPTTRRNECQMTSTSGPNNPFPCCSRLRQCHTSWLCVVQLVDFRQPGQRKQTNKLWPDSSLHFVWTRI